MIIEYKYFFKPPNQSNNIMIRKTVTRLNLQFPVKVNRETNEEPFTVREIGEDIKKTPTDEVARGAILTTKTADGSKEVDTYITQDGGRIDFIKLKWPPEKLYINTSTLEDVRVKHGVPWPSLYPALDAQRATVTLRYVIDSAFPELSGLQQKEGRCESCISQNESLFKPLKTDEHTKIFITDSVYSPIPYWRYKIYCKLVDYGCYRYDAAEIMSSGKTFQFSPNNITDLMSDYKGSTESLLDVGAGNGSATKLWSDQLKPTVVSATEISKRLCKALRKKGFKTHLTGTIRNIDRHDIVLCLNVLDRCYSIREMLDEVISNTNPGGRIIISLPLPLRQVQYRLGEHQELLWPPTTNKESAWEFAAAWFADYILQHHGGGSHITLKRIARLPYLSNGPAHVPLSCLDAAVFVFDKNINSDKYKSLKKSAPLRIGSPIIC